jgi:rubrerythrin
VGKPDEEEGMTKYSVVLDDEKTKTASNIQRCPKCGAVVDKSTPNYCEHCGVEPWEKR